MFRTEKRSNLQLFFFLELKKIFISELCFNWRKL